jgi:hypothetical protein
LAERLTAAGCDYAFGGAIALGYCSEPRGTVDVDVSLYLPVEDVTPTVNVLRQVGGKFEEEQVRRSLAEHGFCRIEFLGRRLDVFLPIAAIYEAARPRRKCVAMGGGEAYIWDAETLCVFKMMFFRRKDLADLDSVLRAQGAALDRDWVEEQLLSMYGPRDPRIASWRELCADVPAT